MITKQVAMDIALAYREIETAQTLLDEIRTARKSRTIPDLRDTFGRQHDGLELGVPSGKNGHRLFNVPWALAEPIIEAHIAAQRAIIHARSLQAAAEIADFSEVDENA